MPGLIQKPYTGLVGSMGYRAFKLSDILMIKCSPIKIGAANLLNVGIVIHGIVSLLLEAGRGGVGGAYPGLPCLLCAVQTL